MSLLTNPWFSAGMGLLASSGPSLTPVNPWRGIGEGLMNAQNAQYAEQQSAYEKMRMDAEQQKMAAEQERQKQLQAFIQSLPPDQQMAASVDPSAFVKSQREQQTAPVKQQGTAGQFGVPGLDPNVPGTATFVNGQLAGFEPTTVQAPPSLPADIQGYEYAKAQGYGGSFENWKMDSARAGAAKIEMGGGDKASPSDVANMVYPDGSQPLPGTLWSEIIARQGRTLTNEEKAAQTARGAQTAKNEEASGKGGDLLGNYLKAADRYQSGILPYGSANSQAIIARNNLVTFYAKNVLGTPGAEPSPALYERAAEIIPDFGGPIDAALFDSRMAEIKRGIDSALGKEGGGKKDQGMGDVEMIYDPKLKRLVPAK